MDYLSIKFKTNQIILSAVIEPVQEHELSTLQNIVFRIWFPYKMYS